MGKRLSLLLLVALIAPWAHAQETYSISATAGQVTQLTEIANAVNIQTCIAFGKAAGCADTGASGTCVAAGISSSCTAAQARAAGARIYPLTQAGREEYVTFQIAAPAFISQKEIPNRVAGPAYCNWFNAQNQTTKDAECTKVGLLAGCSCPKQ